MSLSGLNINLRRMSSCPKILDLYSHIISVAISQMHFKLQTFLYSYLFIVSMACKMPLKYLVSFPVNLSFHPFEIFENWFFIEFGFGKWCFLSPKPRRPLNDFTIIHIISEKLLYYKTQEIETLFLVSWLFLSISLFFASAEPKCPLTERI